MLWNEIVSSICICCSSLIFSASLQGKTKLKILFIQIFSTILYLSSYLFVVNINPDAFAGALTAGFEFLRLFVFFFIEKNEKFNTRKNNLIAMISFSIILTICTVSTWSGWISIFPLISAVLVSLALGNKNIGLIKLSFVIQAIFITIYLLFLSLWINAASQIYVTILGIISLINYLSQNKSEQPNT